MKSCLGLLFVIVVLILVIGGGGFLWYLSASTEFKRTDQSPATTAPRAVPVR